MKGGMLEQSMAKDHSIQHNSSQDQLINALMSCLKQDIHLETKGSRIQMQSNQSK